MKNVNIAKVANERRMSILPKLRMKEDLERPVCDSANEILYSIAGLYINLSNFYLQSTYMKAH